MFPFKALTVATQELPTSCRERLPVSKAPNREECPKDLTRHKTDKSLQEELRTVMSR